MKNLKDEESVDIKQPEDQDVEAENTEDTKKKKGKDLMSWTKKELVERIEADATKYKKLRTQKTNQNKELNETLELREQDAETIQKLADGMALANDEAASLSEQLQLKNSTMRVIEGAIKDYIQANDIAKRNLSKILLSMGVHLEGVTNRNTIRKGSASDE